jgi:hypothetical protein
MKGMRAQHRRRRAFATIACLLWLLGVEVLPNLHLASHDESTHEHTPAGMIVTVTFGAAAHAHDGSVHSHDAADRAAELARHAEREQHRDQLAIDDPVSAHVASGLAHRALALHAPPPPLLAPLPVVRLVTNAIAVPVGRASVAFVATADARGPPAA